MQAEHNEVFEQYQDTVLQIRELSSPRVEDALDENHYYNVLMENFARIGKMSIDNQKILEDHFFPLLEEEHNLSVTERESLRCFSTLLLNPYKMENISVLLRYKIIRKLLSDAESRGDVREIILALDALIETLFVLMHNASRLTPCDGSAFKYRDMGFEVADRLLAYLDKERFAALPDEECRQLVLVNARYISALFDRSDQYSDEINRADFETMKRALALKDNAFYRQQSPDYDWELHEFRTLQYITNFTEICNIRGFSPAELKEIQAYTRQLKALYESDEERYARSCSRGMIDLYGSRIDYLCGELDENSYKSRLFEIAASTDQGAYTLHVNTTFMITFAEYLQVIEKSGLSELDKSRCAYIYQSIISYVHHVPKMRSFSFLLTFMADILKMYRETGGRPREYENFCLELAAALHPPTYVHMLMVADLSLLIARHIYRETPERFIGLFGCKDLKDVQEKILDIYDFAYHAALCHDFGKLFVAEAIITYERALLEEEMDMIRAHPLIGAHILEQHKDTKIYANVARYHHAWYDGSAGYPDKAPEDLPEKLIIDIVRCADCLDASTDTVGRSYKPGLTLDQVCAELEQGRDTSYAGYLVDLITRAHVKNDLNDILRKNRAEHYFRAYQTLLS